MVTTMLSVGRPLRFSEPQPPIPPCQLFMHHFQSLSKSNLHYISIHCQKDAINLSFTYRWWKSLLTSKSGLRLKHAIIPNQPHLYTNIETEMYFWLRPVQSVTKIFAQTTFPFQWTCFIWSGLRSPIVTVNIFLTITWIITGHIHVSLGPQTMPYLEVW